MSGLTLGNPVAPAASAAIGLNNHKVDLAGKCLSTGYKGASNDVVSAFLGGGLQDKAKVLGSILSNISYGSNALQATQGSLEKIASTLTDMLAVVAQSAGNSDENRVTLNNILQQKIAQVKLQTTSAEFDGRKLLMGDLGSDPAVKALFNTSAVSVKNDLAGGTNFKAKGVTAINTLTVANPQAGEVLQFGGAQFKLVSNDPSAPGEFKLGSTNQETARNLATAILNSKDEGLKGYSITVDDANAAVTVEQIAADSEAIPLQGSTNIGLAVTRQGTQGGLNLGGIRNIEGFINSPTANFSVISQVESGANGAAANAASQLGKQYANIQATGVFDGATDAAGDRAAAFAVTIDGKKFTGAMFYANGGDMNDRVLTMTHKPTGEHFTIETHGAYAGGGQLDSDANAKLLANEMTSLFAQSRLNQTKVLAVNTDGGHVFSDDGTKIASMKGVSVSMTSTSFLNKKFTDFKVEDSNGVDVKFTAYVTGSNGNQEFTTTVAQADIAKLVQGYQLNLTDDSTGDVLGINLGEEGLTSVKHVKNHSAIQKAFKDALLNVGTGLDVKVGLAFDDILNVSVKDVSAQSLYLDDAGKYHSELSITDESVAALADEVIKNALKTIRAEQANVQTQIESVREASESLQSVIDITQSSADSYLKADLIKASEDFSSAMKNILAAVSTIQAGKQLAQAAQQLLQQL